MAVCTNQILNCEAPALEALLRPHHARRHAGRQLAEEVAKRRRNGEVMYTSGYTDNAIVHQGRLDPGVLLLTKPYRKSQLADTIRRALNGGAA